MPGLKKLISAYFSFSKKELNGIFLLCLLILLTLGVPFIHRYYNRDEVYDLETFKREAGEFSSRMIKRSENYKALRDQVEDVELKADYFDFNPNGLAERDWRRLGLSSKQIRVILNYEAKGGRFYRKEDLKKIYSITPAQYAALEPYIYIPAYPKSKSGVPAGINKSAEIHQRASVSVIELNSADSVMLESIPGIGPVFASRIVRYRDRLGGFYVKEQLREVYGLDSLKFFRIMNHVKIDLALIKRINLNSATFDELKKHPYLSYKQMNAIIQYRRQNGTYKTISDLKKVAILNEEIIRKIEPYIVF